MAIRQKTQTLRFCYTGLCLQHQPWSVGKSVKERLKNGKNLSHLPLEVAYPYFLNVFFPLKPYRILPWLLKIVEVTRVIDYYHRLQSQIWPKNVHFEPIIRKLDWDHDQFSIYKRFSCKRKNRVKLTRKKCLLIFGVQRNKY